MPTITDNHFDADQVKLAQQGDQCAQQAIYVHFAPQVYRLARHILQCEPTAEEVVQECFVDVLCKIESYRHQGSFAGWLRQIAVNHCLMILRSSWVKKRSNFSEPNWQETEAVEMTHQDRGDHRALRELNSALAGLPAQTRAVLWLYDVEGYSHVEIAKMMGKSKSFSKSQLARAHARLRAQLTLKTESNNTSSMTDTLSPNTGGDSCTPLLNNY